MFGYDTPKQTNPRVLYGVWCDVVAKNPIFGLGVGDAKGD